MAKRKKTSIKKKEKSDFRGLEQLFGSKTRFKLLKTFYHKPSDEFFLRELARLTQNQLNAVRREVINLKEIGLIMEAEREDGKKRYYKLNTNFVLFEDLKNLILKSSVLMEQKLINYLKKLPNIKLCILCGGLVGERAPCDLLLVGNTQKNELEKIINKYEKNIDRSIVYTVFSPEEYKQRKALTDKFLYTILEAKKIVVLDQEGEFSEKENI